MVNLLFKSFKTTKNAKTNRKEPRLLACKFTILTFLALLITFLDLSSKYLVLTHLTVEKPYKLLSFLNLYVTFNLGVAFSLFSRFEVLVRFGAISLALGVSAAIFYYWKLQLSAAQGQIERQNKLVLLASAIFLGGVWGNAIDRVYLHAVIDFIDFHLGAWHFPIFNLADAAISMGSILMAGVALFSARPSFKRR